LHNEALLPQLRNYNQALRRISPHTRYLKMVQADDAIFPRCLEEMVAVAEANPKVGVVSSYRKVGNGVGPSGLPRHKSVMSGREAARYNLIDDLYLFGTQTTVLLRADVVRARHPFYDEQRYFADSDAIYEVLRDHDFAFVHQVLSFSRVDEESIGGRLNSYNALVLDRMIRLKSYGADYLSADELERYSRHHRRLYRRFLAESWLRRREPEFWEFHRKGLALVGEMIETRRFPLDAVPVVLHYALSPEIVARAVARRTRRAPDQLRPNGQKDAERKSPIG
jgi:hypothetical protein